VGRTWLPGPPFVCTAELSRVAGASPDSGGRTALRCLLQTAWRQLRELADPQRLLARSGDSSRPDLRRASHPRPTRAPPSRLDSRVTIRDDR